jgi:hypothetical protein
MHHIVNKLDRWNSLVKHSPPMNNQSPQLWTADDVARYLSIARLTVMLWSRQGRIPGKKIGQVWRYLPAVIKRWAGDHDAKDEPLTADPVHRGLWTQRDLAHYIRVTPLTIGLWARRKQIPAIRIGYCWRFLPSAIRQWVEAGEQPTKASVRPDR